MTGRNPRTALRDSSPQAHGTLDVTAVAAAREALAQEIEEMMGQVVPDQ